MLKIRALTVLSILIFFISVCDEQNLIAQTKIDSLLQIRASAAHDTLKINVDLLIGEELTRANFDSTLFYMNRALETALSLSVDALKYEAESLSALGVAYVNIRQKEKGIELLNKAMTMQKREGLKKELSYTQFDLASTYQGMSNFDTAILHYDSIITRNVADGTSYRLAMSYNYSGLCSYYLRKLDAASERILEAIRFRKTTGDTARIHYPNMVYGLILKEQKQYEEGKAYIRQSREIAKLAGEKARVSLAYTNIGQILILQDSLDAAFESLTNAWEIDKELGRSSVSYYNNVAWIEKQRGDYLKNHEYMVEAVRSIRPNYAPKSKADVYGSLAEAKLLLVDSVYSDFTQESKNLLQAALPYALEGWELANIAESGNVKLKLSEILALIYSKLNQYQKAYEFSQISKAISEEINDQTRTDAIAKMTTEFETERIEGENALLQESQRAQRAQLKQQGYLLIGILIVLLLIIAIAILIQRGRQKLRKANGIIEKSLGEKELLLKEIHHRVKNNLQVVSSLLDLQSREIEDEETQATFMEGQNRVKAMALIHQKLYQNENLATINFEEYANMLVGELGTIYNKKADVNTVVNGGTTSEFDIDTAIPLGLILNELISNAYKYAFNEGEQGALSVSINSLGEGKHQLIVEDNGGGLPESFDFQKAKSLGLRLVRRLAKQLYGSVEYSNIGGAKFVVNFTETLQRKAI
jgi:two-component sensor histidine kinase